MMKNTVILFLFISKFLFGQGGNRIMFEENVSWQQVLVKARSEKKFIFIDCYATWCKPCKEMDKIVYSNDTIASLMNSNFVSLKVQLDTTLNDSKHIKSWYKVANNLTAQYNVSALPTFLFFSPEGVLVHKGRGKKNIEQFITMASDALDDKTQNYILVHQFKQGKLEFQSMKKLATNLAEVGEKDMAAQVARAYIDGYLDKLSLNEFASHENLQFQIDNYKILSTSSRFFEFVYNSPLVFDSITSNNGLALAYAKWLVSKDEIFPKLNIAKNENICPDWKSMAKAIRKKYPKLDQNEIIVDSKIKWYSSKEDWKNYCKYLVEMIKVRGLSHFSTDQEGSAALNSVAWQIFLYSTNKKHLKEALKWAERSIRYSAKEFLAGHMDTKANLLYKLGRKMDAIEFYREIVKLEPRMQRNLDRMIAGVPAWRIPNSRTKDK